MFFFFQDQCFQQSFLLGEQEVCLQAIDNIYHIVDKRRRLLPSQQKVPDKIKEIVVVCKVLFKIEGVF